MSCCTLNEVDNITVAANELLLTRHGLMMCEHP